MLGQAKYELGRAELSGSRAPDLPLLSTNLFLDKSSTFDNEKFFHFLRRKVRQREVHPSSFS